MYWDQHVSGEKAVKVQEEEWVAEDARYKRMGKSGSRTLLYYTSLNETACRS